jgi:hypothetical protein
MGFVVITLCKSLFMYVKRGSCVDVSIVTEVYYLNVALALFNTAMVTPTYYVICECPFSP